jgi:hypothetical protein
MCPESTKSPRIEDLAWGMMKIEGIGTGKDFKLWPGGGREWDWRETGTRHVPGIQPADVEELVAAGCRTVVLSRGMQLKLETCPETLELLRSKGIEVHVAETGEAAELYNRLAEDGKSVGGLFHSTC